MGSEQYVPQNEGANKECDDAWESAFELVEVHRNKAPHDKVKQRPVKDLHETRKAASVEKEVTENEGTYSVAIQ